VQLSHRFGLLLLTALCLALVASCRDTRRTLGSLRSAVEPPTPPPDTIPEMLDYAADLQVDLSEMAKLPIGVLYTDVIVGTGADVVAGDSVEVAFQGWMPNGTKVDSADLVLRVGAGDVIAGIDAALPGMKPGGKRKLVLPPGLGYGGEGKANVPPNTVLVYDVELRARMP
jgi:FKBP-type peptidyl-prolyl cis-trans isomerase FkpA